jgi:serine/threonine protein kinase
MMPGQSASEKMKIYVMAEMQKITLPNSYSGELQLDYLQTILTTLPYVSTIDKKPTDTPAWHKIIQCKKLYEYNRDYEGKKFTPERYIRYVESIRTAPGVVQGIVALWNEVKSLTYDRKYRRKDPENKLFSIFKLQERYFLITRLLYTQPTKCSVIKVAIPITELNGKLILNFSAPMLLKITYAADLDVEKQEALPLLYGESVQIRKRYSGAIQLEKQYILMALLPGIMLVEHYKSIAKKITLTYLLELLLAIVTELQRIHAAHWIHYDLKPENIVISHSPEGKPMARIVNTNEMEKLQPEQVISPKVKSNKGTHPYRAPELVISERHTPTHEIDIYALGIIFVEILNVDKDYEKIAPIASAIKFGDGAHEGKITGLLPNDDTIDILGTAAPELTALIKSMIDFYPGDRPSLRTIIERLTLLLLSPPKYQHRHLPQHPPALLAAPIYPIDHIIKLEPVKKDHCLVM